MAAGYGVHAGEVLLVEHDDPACGNIDTGQQVEDSGLSGTVRTDQTHDLVLTHLDIEVADCGKSAEYYPEVLAFQYAAHSCTPFAPDSSAEPVFFFFAFFFPPRMRLTMCSMLLPMEKSYVPISPFGRKSIIMTRASE